MDSTRFEGPDAGLNLYQSRNVKIRRIHGVSIASAPPPPYFSFHAARKGLKLPEVRPSPPHLGGYGVRVLARALPLFQGLPSGEEVHAVYLDTWAFSTLDLRSERHYASNELEALGWPGPPERTSGTELQRFLCDCCQDGISYAAGIYAMGFQGVCLGAGLDVWWVLAGPGIIKWTKLIDPGDLDEIARLETFDPQPMKSPDNLKSHPEMRHRLAGLTIRPEDLSGEGLDSLR